MERSWKLRKLILKVNLIFIWTYHDGDGSAISQFFYHCANETVSFETLALQMVHQLRWSGELKFKITFSTAWHISITFVHQGQDFILKLSHFYTMLYYYFSQLHGRPSKIIYRLKCKRFRTNCLSNAKNKPDTGNTIWDIELTEYITAIRRMSSPSFHFEKSLSTARAMRKHWIVAKIIWTVVLSSFDGYASNIGPWEQVLHG